MKLCFSLIIGMAFLSQAPAFAVTLDDFSSNQNFTSGKYTFVQVAGTAGNNPVVSGGNLHIDTVGRFTAGFLWNAGDLLAEAGDVVSIDVLIDTSATTEHTAGLYFSPVLGPDPNYVEIRLDSTAWYLDGPWGPSFLSSPPSGFSTLQVEVLAVGGSTMDIQATLSGSGFDTIVETATVNATSLYFGPVAWNASGTDISHDNFAASTAAAVPLGTVDNVSINGGGSEAILAPGESFDVGVDYTMRSPDGCPGCIAQVVIGTVEGNQDCVYWGSPGESPGTSGSGTVTLTAPASPGIYELHYSWDLQFTCQDAIAGFEERAIPIAATITVAEGFLDVAAGPEADASSGLGVAWIDYDDDGDLDIYLARNAPNQLFRNDGGSFTDVAGVSGAIVDNGSGRGMAWGDYDNDGDLDVYLSNWGSANKLLRNDDGMFADATVLAGPLGDANIGQAVSWVDYDLDGDLDLYLANQDAPNKMFRNDGVLFTDVSSAPLNDAGNCQAAAWGDYDNDGDPDLYLTRHGSNLLIRNDEGTFVDVSTSPIDEVATSHGAAWGDYDNDGDLDLYVGNQGSPNRLYRNDGGSFTDATSGPLGDMGSALAISWSDVDNDGDLDLVIAANGPNKLFRNDGGGSFVDATEFPLSNPETSVGLSAGDFDKDGDLDFYVANFGQPNRLYENIHDNANHWLHLNLTGAIANRSAIGTRVRIVAGGIAQIREITSGGGYLSQESLTVEFGLGSATTVDLLQIFWPSGALQQATDVPVDRVLNVTEGGQVAVAVSAFDAQWDGAGVRVRWMLADASEEFSFEIDRRKGRVGSFLAVPGSVVAQADGSFVMKDTATQPGTEYTYRLTVRGQDFDLTQETSVATPRVPVWLEQNVPNPFNPETTINFTLDRDALADLSIFDARGRWVITLADGEFPAGESEVVWTGRDASNRPVGSGVYFYKLRVDGRVLTKRMLLVK